HVIVVWAGMAERLVVRVTGKSHAFCRGASGALAALALARVRWQFTPPHQLLQTARHRLSAAFVDAVSAGELCAVVARADANLRWNEALDHGLSVHGAVCRTWFQLDPRAAGAQSRWLSA